MTDSKKISSILALGLVSNIICNVVYDLVQISGIWYKGNAFAFVCYAFVLFKVLKSNLSKIILALCISQLADEFFGSPHKLDPVEYLAALGVIVYFIFQKKKV